MDPAVVERAKEVLDGARRITVMTGAGISAESGVPTFRGAGGLWRNHRPEDLASPDAFARDPDLVWEWYGERRQTVASVQPNDGHLALARLEDRSDAFTLITQNVDDLHERAGSDNILHLHGSLWRTRCLVCYREENNRELPFPSPYECGECGGTIRPGVVWFGESLDMAILGAAQRAAENCDLFMVIGTSAVVQPAASLALVAQDRGASLIEVNRDETPITPLVDVSLRGGAGELLGALIPQSS